MLSGRTEPVTMKARTGRAFYRVGKDRTYLCFVLLPLEKRGLLFLLRSWPVCPDADVNGRDSVRGYGREF